MLFSASVITIAAGSGGVGGAGGDGTMVGNNDGTSSMALFTGFGGDETDCAIKEPISNKIATEVINCFI